jgi:hypothetical protein
MATLFEAALCLVAGLLVIAGMIGVFLLMNPRKTRQGDQFLSNTVERRYRLEQEP